MRVHYVIGFIFKILYKTHDILDNYSNLLCKIMKKGSFITCMEDVKNCLVCHGFCFLSRLLETRWF